MEKEEEKQGHYDSCFSWIVCMCSFVSHVVLAFNIVCFGVLLPDFTTHFEQTQSVMGILGASRLGILYFSGTIGGGLTQVYGCRVVAMSGFTLAAIGSLASAFVTHLGALILLFGIVSGIGSGVSYIPLTVIVQRYFKRRRALAIGIASAGLSFGSVTLGVSSGVLLQWLTWRGYLVVLACCNMQILLAASFFFPVHQKKKTNNGEKPESSLTAKEQFKTEDELTSTAGVDYCRCLKKGPSSVFDISLFQVRRYLVFTLSFLFVNMGFAGSYMLGPNRAVVQGVDKLYIGFLVTSVGCMSFCGRILAGFIADFNVIDISLHFSACVFCNACVLYLSTLAGSSLILHILFSGLVGFTMGSYEGIHAMVVVGMLGSERLPKGMAWIQCMRGLSNLVALPFTGWLFDISQGYLIPYIVVASLQMCGAVAVFSTRFIKHPKTPDTTQQDKASEDPLMLQDKADGNSVL